MSKGEDIRLWRDAGLPGGLELLRASCVDHRYLPHFHAEFVVAAFKCGAQRHRIVRREGVAFAGTVMVISPGDAHTGEAAERGERWEYCAYYPPADLMDDIAADVLGGSGALDFGREPLRTDPVLARTLLAAHRVIESTPDTLEKQNALFSALSALVSRYGQRTCKGIKPSRANTDLRGAIAFMNDHYSQKITIRDIAQIASLSDYHFMRVFRNQTGLSVHRFLTQLRLERAKVLLSRGGRPADVAVTAGFYDQSHLTNQFKAWFGTTPNSYSSACR
jgi:AraC-like DNA-binding protein